MSKHHPRIPRDKNRDAQVSAALRVASAPVLAMAHDILKAHINLDGQCGLCGEETGHLADCPITRHSPIFDAARALYDGLPHHQREPVAISVTAPLNPTPEMIMAAGRAFATCRHGDPIELIMYRVISNALDVLQSPWSIAQEELYST